MRVLFFGDVVGQPGRNALRQFLPGLKEEIKPDLVLANVENASAGRGLSERGLKEILSAGVDFMTSGDHSFALQGSSELLDSKDLPLLRPLNWPGKVAGRGFGILTLGARRILLINLAGRVFIRQDFDDPFQKISELLEEYSLKGKEQGSEPVDGIIVDFHAEATSEKAALSWFLDGKVSAVLGTHTHVPTADEKILPGGSAFISDVGMVGPAESVLGIDKEIIIKRFLTQRMLKMEVAKGPVEINGIILEIDDRTGLVENIQRVRKQVVLD